MFHRQNIAHRHKYTISSELPVTGPTIVPGINMHITTYVFWKLSIYIKKLTRALGVM